jgi:hypothetical protein
MLLEQICLAGRKKMVLITKDMKVGFTGSREGITDEQYIRIKNLLISGDTTEVHHGDCIGADAYMHEIAGLLEIRIVIHPPDLPGLRCFCSCDELREEKPFLERNQDIVDETDVLIACPNGTKETMRSGTWATIRYAEKQKKTILLIYPSGRIFKITEGFGRRN